MVLLDKYILCTVDFTLITALGCEIVKKIICLLAVSINKIIDSFYFLSGDAKGIGVFFHFI